MLAQNRFSLYLAYIYIVQPTGNSRPYMFVHVLFIMCSCNGLIICHLSQAQ